MTSTGRPTRSAHSVKGQTGRRTRGAGQRHRHGGRGHLVGGQGTMKPRRCSVRRKRSRPRCSRLRIVPTGQTRCAAACSWVRPSRWQSTIAALSLPGSRSISSWSAAPRSSRGAPAGASRIRSAALLSRTRRRRSEVLAPAEILVATECNQGPSESRTQSDPARRARNRNVIWNASCAAWGSRRIARQARRTIGPWRSTRAVNASSAAPRAAW